MNVICLQEQAFYDLLDKVYAHLDKKLDRTVRKWIPQDEAMKRLNVKSKTTMQKFRDEGRIRFSQPERRIILYDVDSINEYLERNAKEVF